MPHLTVEYSANLEDEVDIPGLVRALHETALACPTFKKAAVRTRAERRDIYEIADSDPENAFVAVGVRILEGRPDETKAAIGEMLFETLTTVLADVYERRPIGISLDISEISNTFNYKKNNLHDIMAKKEAAE